jgi:hypothetical protein
MAAVRKKRKKRNVPTPTTPPAQTQYEMEKRAALASDFLVGEVSEKKDE